MEWTAKKKIHFLPIIFNKRSANWHPCGVFYRFPNRKTLKVAAGPAPRSRETKGRHLLLYDGVCGLCNRTIGFVLPRDPEGRFQFAALQSSIGREHLLRHGRDPERLTTFFVVQDHRSPSPRLLGGAQAALFVASQLQGPWRHLAVLHYLPGFVLESAYNLIARNRYLVFGKLDTCLIPPSGQRNRFIDLQEPSEFRREESP